MRFLFWRKPPKPRQRYCTYCGAEMVDGYKINERRFDPQTGEPQECRVYGWVCKETAGHEYAPRDIQHDGVFEVLHGEGTWVRGHKRAPRGPLPLIPPPPSEE